MKSRAGSVCAALLLWLCALGAGPARHSSVARVAPGAARSAVEIALHDVADGPQLGTRVIVAVGAQRGLATPWSAHLASPVLEGEHPRVESGCGASEVLRVQGASHRRRPRWRTHDAAAPPRGFLVTPIAR